MEELNQLLDQIEAKIDRIIEMINEEDSAEEPETDQ